MASPDDLGRGLVSVTAGGGSYRVELTAPGRPPVALGPYHSLSVARGKADAIRGFVAAILRSAAAPTGGGDPAFDSELTDEGNDLHRPAPVRPPGGPDSDAGRGVARLTEFTHTPDSFNGKPPRADE